MASINLILVLVQGRYIFHITLGPILINIGIKLVLFQVIPSWHVFQFQIDTNIMYPICTLYNTTLVSIFNVKNVIHRQNLQYMLATTNTSTSLFVTYVTNDIYIVFHPFQSNSSWLIVYKSYMTINILIFFSGFKITSQLHLEF